MIVLFVAGFVTFVVLVELLAAVLPLLIVMIWVPAEERPALAAVVAAASERRRLTCRSALRVIAARRLVASPARNGAGDRGEAVANAAGNGAGDRGEAVANPAGNGGGDRGGAAGGQPGTQRLTSSAASPGSRHRAEPASERPPAPTRTGKRF